MDNLLNLMVARARKNHYVLPVTGPVRFNQVIKSGDGSNYDHSVTFPSITIPAGALIVVKFETPQSPTMLQPSGLSGDTFVQGPNFDSTSSSTQGDIWYVLGSVGGSAAVTAALSNGANEYGASIEVYTGGTWTYDATNSGVVVGAYTTSPTVTPSLSTSGAGVIATCFGQYDWPRAGNFATQTPGSVINSSSDGTTCVMASGEVVNSSAFSGTISVSIQQPTPAYTKCDLAYASFLMS